MCRDPLQRPEIFLKRAWECPGLPPSPPTWPRPLTSLAPTSGSQTPTPSFQNNTWVLLFLLKDGEWPDITQRCHHGRTWNTAYLFACGQWFHPAAGAAGRCPRSWALLCWGSRCLEHRGIAWSYLVVILSSVSHPPPPAPPRILSFFQRSFSPRTWALQKGVS